MCSELNDLGRISPSCCINTTQNVVHLSGDQLLKRHSGTYICNTAKSKLKELRSAHLAHLEPEPFYPSCLLGFQTSFPKTTMTSPALYQTLPHLHYSLEAEQHRRKPCSGSLCKCAGKRALQQSTVPPTQWEAAAGLSAVAGIMAGIYYNYLSPLKEARLLLK